MVLYRSEYNQMLKGFKANVKANAQAASNDSLLSASNTQSTQQKPQGKSLFNKFKKIAINVGKGVGKAVEAVAKPAVDVVTGKEGKAVHDTAQLASDVSGGVANDITNRVRKQVGNLEKPAATSAQRQSLIDTQTKAAQAVKSGRISKSTVDELNKVANQQGAGASTYKAALNEMAKPNSSDKSVLTIIKKGQKLNSSEEKSAAGAVAAAATMVPAGEAARIAKGGKDLVTAVAKSGTAGAVANEGATLEHNPNATSKELGTAGLVGLAGGGIAPVVGKLFDMGADAYLSKVKLHGKESGMKDVMTPAEADKAAAAAYTKITPTDQSAGAEEVGVRTPIHSGVKQQSTTFRINIRTAQKMSDKEYTTRFNTLSKSYEKETKALENLAPAEQKARGNALDLKYQAKLADLDNEYQHGTLSKQKAPKKIASETIPAEKPTGGAPISGVNVRSDAYKIGTKSRVTTQEATQKLKTAGYSSDETKTILQDALPEKPLSMPGSKPNIGLNDASVQKAAANFDESKGEPVKAPETSAPVIASSDATALQKVATTESSNLRPLAATTSSETGTSKLGASVREKAIQEKIISKTEAEAENLPTYVKADMKEQAQFATDMIKEDPQTAIDIALGKKEAPAHMLPQMVYNAVEEYARGVGGEDGAKLLLDLSRSKQVSNLTTMAQNVRAAGERDPHSPVNAINQVKVAREEAAMKRGKSVAKEAQKDAATIRKATPKITKDDWTSFVDGLRC